MSHASAADASALRPGELRVRVDAHTGDVDGSVGHAAAAGVVVGTAAGGGRRHGTRVACLAGPAATGDTITVHEALAFAIPDALDAAAAAALLCSWPAAWFALHHVAGLQAGESVLVLDATSPVGIACVQLAKAAGARVMALTRLRAGFDAARRAGAHDVVSLQESLWPDIVREHGGADVIAGIADADVVTRSMRCLARGGRLLMMAPPAGFAAALAIQPLLLRAGALHAAHWGAAEQRRATAPILAALSALWAEGRIRL